ncbi:hypothetical protein LOTGIDRAFT_157021 [Lottia gigantea]|uniref:Uncharacterized protein n=1 Tax=Lottia gigantea TaxID=225164 RepID=V4CLA0_LOTGI|nr:hypothetical protein LOTGIDRAFT_157021 [Lottia gigantea]ESP03060.1 hypothetical protein LOTGIDRAFT_157021 [Lottia gigantea]
MESDKGQGHNCLAEFVDFNGTARSEIISVSDGIVDFGVVQCQCYGYLYYYSRNGEPRAGCIPKPPTTQPAMCTCIDGTQVPYRETVWITACHILDACVMIIV